MSYSKKRFTALLLCLFILFSVSGCGLAQTGNNSKSTSSATTPVLSNDSLIDGELFSASDKEIGYDESAAVMITLSDDKSESTSDAVTISGNTITIAGEGTYILSGSLTNGQILVEAKKTDKLRLVLNGVNLNCDTSAAIYIKQADKVFITLADGSQNTLSNKSEFVAIDENSIDSVLFSKEDLTLNGEGALTINAAYGHGTVSKDDLVITGGRYTITAASHALSGKDSVRIADGVFTLSAGKDGIHAENSDDASLGFLYIAGGNFDIISGGDGMAASSALQMENGTIQIVSGGGSINGAVTQDNPPPGTPGVKDTTTTTATADTISSKGLKAAGNLIINGGTITIDSADDALHSNAGLAINDGTISLSSGDDGVHADASLAISAGNLTVTKSYEGIEGQSIDILGGVVTITASDDGLNAAGGNDQSGFGGGMGRDSFSVDENCYIKISGGKLTVDASGDGIDANGSLYVSGGETYVSGPTNSGNGALDYNGDAQITGGIFVAVGASGMAQSFGSSSTQGSILVNLAENQAGTELVLYDSTDVAILNYTPKKSYSSVVVSCPQIKQGESYTLHTGALRTAIDMTSLIYGSGGGMGGKPSGAGGAGGAGGVGGAGGGQRRL